MSSAALSNDDWVDFLYRNNVLENEDERQKRQQVIALLQTAVASFTRDVIRDRGLKKLDPTCQLLAFGSYGLGGYTRNADMDLVLICPWSIKRQDFYRFFTNILKKMATCRDVDTIRRATVPIIKCTIDSISIDISFVRLKETKIPPNINLLDDALLNDIDSTCVASMDGPRVMQFIKSQVKNEHIFIFQKSLQIIKYWASQRQIYSKPFGFMNGSTWTMLLVKTYINARTNPNLTITSLITSFFRMWKDWPWPTPVMFTDAIPGKNGTKLNYQTLTEFEEAVMPIVSPCYPVCSAAPYVNKSTLKIMTRELERASIILEYNAPPRDLLSKFFHPLNYFKRYDHFISVLTTADTYQSCDVWTRKIAYNIPSLISLLESCPDIEYMQPFTKSYTLHKTYRAMQEKKALQLGYSFEDAKILEQSGQLQPGMLYLIYSFVGIQIKKSVTHVDISSQADSFKALLESKRKKNDSDVHWTLQLLSKTKVAEILEQQEE